MGRARMFTGTFDRQLDDKGRLALPAVFKSKFGDSCYIVQGAGRCLQVYFSEDFEAEAEKMSEQVDRGELSLDAMRARMASAGESSIDKQGRITVVEHLRSYAELSAPMPVVVTGAYDRLEIWEPSRFARLRAAGDAHMAVGAP